MSCDSAVRPAAARASVTQIMRTSCPTFQYQTRSCEEAVSQHVLDNALTERKYHVMFCPFHTRPQSPVHSLHLCVTFHHRTAAFTLKDASNCFRCCFPLLVLDAGLALLLRRIPISCQSRKSNYIIN